MLKYVHETKRYMRDACTDSPNSCCAQRGHFTRCAPVRITPPFSTSPLSILLLMSVLMDDTDEMDMLGGIREQDKGAGAGRAWRGWQCRNSSGLGTERSRQGKAENKGNESAEWLDSAAGISSREGH